MATIKEIKDDALITIQVNKSFYLMTKALSLYLFQKIDVEDKETYFKDLMNKSYKDLDEHQRAMYPIILLLAEIETQAKESDQYEEKELIEPIKKG
jgi:ribosome-binding ATPase YchF (GTP1/OBG family)